MEGYAKRCLDSEEAVRNYKQAEGGYKKREAIRSFESEAGVEAGENGGISVFN